MLNRRTFTSALAALAVASPFGVGSAMAQDLTKVTFVQPSPSAINSFNVFVAIGEGFFKPKKALTSRSRRSTARARCFRRCPRVRRSSAVPAPARCWRRAAAAWTWSSSTTSPPVELRRRGAADSPVQGPADLKGKVVGTGTADGAEVGFARNVMSGSGLTRTPTTPS
jgi:NitT/TauT family transport system substrate-binding protein